MLSCSCLTSAPLSNPTSLSFLKACGFEEEGGSGEGGSLVLKPANEKAEQIAAGKSALKAVLKHHTEVITRAAEERRKEAGGRAKLADLAPSAK